MHVLNFAGKGSPTQMHQPAYMFTAKHMHTYQWDRGFNPSSRGSSNKVGITTLYLPCRVLSKLMLMELSVGESHYGSHPAIANAWAACCTHTKPGES